MTEHFRESTAWFQFIGINPLLPVGQDFLPDWEVHLLNWSEKYTRNLKMGPLGRVTFIVCFFVVAMKFLDQKTGIKTNPKSIYWSQMDSMLASDIHLLLNLQKSIKHFLPSSSRRTFLWAQQHILWRKSSRCCSSELVVWAFPGAPETQTTRQWQSWSAAVSIPLQILATSKGVDHDRLYLRASIIKTPWMYLYVVCMYIHIHIHIYTHITVCKGASLGYHPHIFSTMAESVAKNNENVAQKKANEKTTFFLNTRVESPIGVKQHRMAAGSHFWSCHPKCIKYVQKQCIA